jgi:hypothetical protein
VISRRALLRAAVAGALGSTTAIRRASAAAAEEPENLASLLVPIRSGHDRPALAAAFVQGADLKALGAVGSRRAGVSDPVEPADRFHLGSARATRSAGASSSGPGPADGR